MPLSQDAFEANLAITKALGLDPKNIRRGGVRLTLDGEVGPVLEVTYFLRNAEGHLYAIDDEVATELRRYKLVPIDSYEPSCIACGQPTLVEDDGFGVKFVRCRSCNP